VLDPRVARRGHQAQQQAEYQQQGQKHDDGHHHRGAARGRPRAPRRRPRARAAAGWRASHASQRHQAPLHSALITTIKAFDYQNLYHYQDPSTKGFDKSIKISWLPRLYHGKWRP
jgi:hypothetical protein